MGDTGRQALQLHKRSPTINWRDTQKNPLRGVWEIWKGEVNKRRETRSEVFNWRFTLPHYTWVSCTLIIYQHFHCQMQKIDKNIAYNTFRTYPSTESVKQLLQKENEQMLMYTGRIGSIAYILEQWAKGNLHLQLIHLHCNMDFTLKKSIRGEIRWQSAVSMDAIHLLTACSCEQRVFSCSLYHTWTILGWYLRLFGVTSSSIYWNCTKVDSAHDLINWESVVYQLNYLAPLNLVWL